MGVEDSIRKATENAMEDLAGTSDPVDDGHVPEPGQKDDDIQVHSSISEGSNAMDEDSSADRSQAAPGTSGATGDAPRHRSEDTHDAGTHLDSDTDDDVPVASGDVAGPAGLPSGDPDDLRADPSEGGGDPSTSMGRG